MATDEARKLQKIVDDYRTAPNPGGNCLADNAAPNVHDAMPLVIKAIHDVTLAFGELIGNVVRHAGAADVEVAINHGGTDTVLHVMDGGSGFSPAGCRKTSMQKTVVDFF